MSVDVAAIMREHNPGGGDESRNAPEYTYECCGDNYDCGYMWPCPTYRLAAEVERLRAAAEGVDMLVAKAERRGAVKAWDEGYRSGFSRAMRRMSDEPNVQPATNPYTLESL